GAGALVQGLAHSTIDSTQASSGFIDISTTGAKLGFTPTADDETASFNPNPAFETWLWGKRVTGQVVVSSNGFLVFGNSAATRSGTLPIPNATIEPNFVAPLWADLQFTPASAAYWQVQGDAPDRVLIVQWTGLEVFDEPGSSLTFQAQIHQTGVVRFEYRTVTHSTGTVVVGVQGSQATLGLQATEPWTGRGLVFFGPRASPVSLTAHKGAVVVGWVKIGSGYLKLEHTPSLMNAGDLVITEALYSPATAIAATGEWLEITNHTGAVFDLSGWSLDFGGGRQHTLDAANGTVTIPAGGSLILGQSATGPATDGVAVGYVYGTSLAMDDASGTVALGLNGATGASLSWAAGQGGAGVSVAYDPGPVLLSTDASGTAPHGLAGSSTASFGTQTPLQLGTPGAPNPIFGYSMKSIPVAFEDISATGTAVLNNTGSDDQVGSANLTTFPFSYFGAPQSTLTVSSNGWMFFGTTTATALTNRTTPSLTGSAPKGAVAPFWDDLDFGTAANTNAYVQHVPTNSDPTNPGAHWIVQWHQFTHYSAGDDLNFQVKLFDNGTLEFHFATMTSGTSSNYASGYSATTWIEKPTGASAMVLNVNTAGGIQPNTAYRFTP
ncbi:MAG: lamin tail domain-containing protein, partial [Myxococcaceae bacterium]